MQDSSDWSNLHLTNLIHSCLHAIPWRFWFAKDNAVNVKAHLAPGMRESKQIAKSGMILDLLSWLPPWWVSGRGDEARLHTLPLETEPGTKANRAKRPLRELLVRAVRILPQCMWSFDGATTFNLTGTSARSRLADPFSNEDTDDMGSFLEMFVVRKGMTLAQVADEVSPGCTNPQHRDHWIVDHLCRINDHSKNTELQASTREPPRRREGGTSANIGRQSRIEQVLGAAGESDGRTDTRLPFLNEAFTRLKYDHARFVPVINGKTPLALHQ